MFDLEIKIDKDDKIYNFLKANNLILIRNAYEQLTYLLENDRYLNMTVYDLNELCINIYYYTIKEYLSTFLGSNDLLDYDIEDFIDDSTKFIVKTVAEGSFRASFLKFIDNAGSFYMDKKPLMFDGFYILPKEEIEDFLIKDKKLLIDITTNLFNHVLDLIKSQYKGVNISDINTLDFS